jgi:RNA polymerase sigma-70 factor (ECF subfamily)
LRAGDDAAFEAVVLANTPRLLAVARRFLPEEQDALDAVQDAFLSAFKGVAKFDGGSKLSTWLHRITVNTCLMKLRSRRRRPQRSIEDLLPSFDATEHHVGGVRSWDRSPAANPGRGLEMRELRQQVRKAIDELPDDFRDVILLRDIEGLDTHETSVMLGISDAAVKTRLHRARQALRTLLDRIMNDGREP